MPRDSTKTRDRILDAANRLFYAGGIRSVGVDAVAAAAGVTKRTLYYHFRSKDDLVAAALKARDQPSRALFVKWFEACDGSLADRVEALFTNVARAAHSPRWRGCGFLRTISELADMPGHPAVKVGAAHKKRFEDWLADRIAADGHGDAAETARQIVVLMDGTFAALLTHRDPAYAEAAGQAAAQIVRSRAAKGSRQAG